MLPTAVRTLPPEHPAQAQEHRTSPAPSLLLRLPTPCSTVLRCLCHLEHPLGPRVKKPSLRSPDRLPSWKAGAGSGSSARAIGPKCLRKRWAATHAQRQRIRSMPHRLKKSKTARACAPGVTLAALDNIFHHTTTSPKCSTPHHYTVPGSCIRAAQGTVMAVSPSPPAQGGHTCMGEAPRRQAAPRTLRIITAHALHQPGTTKQTSPGECT